MGRAVSHGLDPDVGGSASNPALCPRLPPSGWRGAGGPVSAPLPCDPAPSPGGGETPPPPPQRRADARQPRALQHQGLRSCKAFVAKLGSQGGTLSTLAPPLPMRPAPGTSWEHPRHRHPHSWGLSYMPPVQRGDDHQPHASDVGTEPDGGAATTGSQQDAHCRGSPGAWAQRTRPPPATPGDQGRP